MVNPSATLAVGAWGQNANTALLKLTSAMIPYSSCLVGPLAIIPVIDWPWGTPLSCGRPLSHHYLGNASSHQAERSMAVAAAVGSRPLCMQGLARLQSGCNKEAN